MLCFGGCAVVFRSLAILIAALALVIAACAPGGGAGAGDANRGRTVFEQKGCPTCHALSSVPSATGTIGPPLNGIGATAANRKPGTAAADYIRESETSPNAFVVDGFPSPSSMIPFAGSDQELSDLVAFLLTQ
ncbi:MAG: c-type cytochrome [Chloroflexi bacterium]|nr:c-type cytochrome [Chloroflexota bacterium]